MTNVHFLYHLPKRAAWLLLFCVTALAACTQDDDAVGGAPVEVCLAVTADHEETLPARQAADDTEEGRTHEYMHELCVFIVDADGKIEHRVLPNLSGDDDAARGDLKEWTSYPILLTPGKKTLYAFANWQTAADKDWIALVNQTEGARFDVEKLNSIVLDDPAAKLNFDAGRFIPMAASTTATVTASTRELRIGLDRLVSKLRLTARLDKGVIRGCTFEGVATQCHLLGIAPASSRTKSYTMPTPTPLANGVYVFPDVYINATYGTEQPFTVTLETDENAGTTYTAQTDRKEVPRNSIYPLNLTLGSLVPRIGVRSWVSPIGSYPVEVVTDFNAKAFTVSLAEGSQFEFSINGINDINGAADPTNIAAAWSLPATTPDGVVFDGTASDVTVKGHLTTLPVGSTFTLGVDVSWTAGGKHYGRHYTLTVRIKDITDVVFKQPTRRLLPAEWLWMD